MRDVCAAGASARTRATGFGEALVVIAGQEQKAHYFCLDLPQSDDYFVRAFPAETTEAFLEGPSKHSLTWAVYRRRFCTTTRRWQWRRFWAMVRESGRKRLVNCRSTTCSPSDSGVRAKETTKAKWKGWWAMRVGTYWCRFPVVRTGRS